MVQKVDSQGPTGQLFHFFLILIIIEFLFNVNSSNSQALLLFSIFFSPDEVRSFEDTQHQDLKKFAAFFHAMLSQGVSLPPSAYEAWFVSGAHTDKDIEVIASASKVAAVTAASTAS